MPTPQDPQAKEIETLASRIVPHQPATDNAVEQGAILFFDEAEALLSKRTEVKDSHGRYANQEIAPKTSESVIDHAEPLRHHPPK